MAIKQKLLAAVIMAALMPSVHAAPSAPPAGLPAGFEAQFSHHYAQANGARLHYVVGGPVDGPLVVLLHGWPQTWYTWRNVMPNLASVGYRVVAVDYRGAGQSEKTASGYDKAAMAADIRALVQSLGVSNVNLVGRDIGVMVAYAYAAQWPREVKTLTMLDVPIPATPAWNDAKHKPDPDIWHFGFFQRPDIPELLIAGHEFAFIRNFIHDREYRPIADDDIRVYADAYAAAGGLRAGFELYRAFPQDEQRFAEFEKTKLPMPVLALAGDRSNGTVELSMAQGLATDVTGGTAPETGHWLPDENPVFLCGQLVSFLRAHDR
ncbi:alpha/beta fold hydrolase [Bradyrhizobium sp. USDA 4454]